MLDAPVAGALGEIQVPVLAFFGADDKLIPNRYLHPALTPQDIADEAQAALPRASVHLIDAAGHLLMIERPDPVNEALRAFLDDGEMARRQNATRARQSIHINTGPSMGKISVNGTRLHYRISGTGEPLVFVHGLGSSSQDWSRQVDGFSDSYRVITFDVRGHGQSDKPEGPYSIPLFAEDTAALLRAVEAAPANIVGLSMGGMIALQLALDAPDLVKRLVVVNSTPEAELDSLRDRWIYWSRRLASRVLGMRATGKMIANRIFVKPEQGTLRQQFIERWAANDKQAYLNTVDAIAGWSVADQLDEITCPALIVAADKDYTPVSAKREYATRMPNAELTIIEDSHHATPVERPRAFNHVLDNFLQTTDAAAHPHPPKGA